MITETLKSLKEVHETNSTPVMYGTEGFSLWAMSNGDLIVFDDTHQVMHAIRAVAPGTPEYTYGTNQMIMIKSFWYRDIKTVSSSNSIDNFKSTWLDGYFKDKGLISEIQSVILKKFADSLEKADQPIVLPRRKYETVREGSAT